MLHTPDPAATPRPGGAAVLHTAVTASGRVSAQHLTPGLVLEGYEIIAPIGEGGMGVVYRAYDPKLDRNVAIKVVRSTDPETGKVHAGHTARMLREAQAMAKLSHPNVASIFQVGKVSNSIFIVMEYIKGGTFHHWLKQQPRSWRQIVDVLVKAGRGLEAAHHAGLVHRDFKPDNILIGDDGRVRVTDFGLARAQAARDPKRSHEHADGSVTKTGAIMGTPAYMAPEQFQAIAGDGRLDQFAFCVTLYEALVGKRPFAGDSMSDIMDNVLAGKVEPFPFDLEVPRSVRQIVMRGLSIAPEDRFPSMHELLAELDRRPISKVTVGVGMVAAAALAFGVVMLTRSPSSGPPPCAQSDQKLAEVWNPKVRDAVAKAFDTSALPYAASERDSVLANIDNYSMTWLKMHRDSCQATRVRGEQSEQLLDRRTLCLDRRLSELSAFTESLSTSTPEAIRTAVVASQRLSPIDDCAAANLEHEDSPSLQTRAAVSDIGVQLARAKVALNGGSFAPSFDYAKAAIDKSRGLRLPRQLSEALLIAGKAQRERELLDQAEDLMIQAVAAAEASNSRELEVEAYTELVYLDGYDRGNFRQSTVWAQLAEAGVADGVGGKAMQARLFRNRGTALFQEGRPADALEQLQKSLALRKEMYPQGHPDLAESLDNVGSALLHVGQAEKALMYHREAVAMFEKLLGAEHPSTADAVTNLANALAANDDADKAEQLYQRALDTYTRSFGPMHTTVAVALTNLAMLSVARKDYEVALTDLRRALDIEKAARGPMHPAVAETLANIARAQLGQHKPELAIASLNEALAIWEKAERVPPDADAARFVMAKALWQEGDRRRALDLATAARDHLKSVGGAWVATVEEIDAWIAKPE